MPEPTAAPTSVRQHVLHMVGNAHIDPVWLWQWPEGYQEARATFWSAIHRLEEYPDFVFTCNQIVLLSWVEESDPDLFEAIRAKIAEGRWVMVGGWWVEPDCNVPTGESFVRQGLYGQRYLWEKFGVTATVGLNADPFGHNATIPQILRKQGIWAYSFLRPGPHEAELPGQPFWWESPDGSRVLTYRIPHEYCSPRADITHHTEQAVTKLPPGDGERMVFYGVGNHGGGPTKANIESIEEMNRGGALGRLEFSTPPAFFERMRETAHEAPVWNDDLQHHAAGCYSAHSGVKQWMRTTEHALVVAERWATIAAHSAGLAYPQAELTHAWKQVLFNQFHDILPGSALEPAYDDARDQLGEARAIAARVTNRSTQVIARDVDIPMDVETQPVLVFNPQPWPVRADVEVEGSLFEATATIEDETGAAVPVQTTRQLATMSDRRRKRLVFPADLPPLGYRLYRIRPTADPATESGSAPAPDPVSVSGRGPLRATGTTLENDHLRAEVDPATGWLSALVDKTTGHDLVGTRPGPHTVVSEDRTDTWGHRVVTYAGDGEPFTCDRVQLVEDGPVRGVLRIESSFGRSRMIEELSLSRDERHVRVRVSLNWQEQLRLLKLRVPTALTDTAATFEIPYGHLARDTAGDEEPGQSWVDVRGSLPGGARAGLAVLCDAKSAYDVSGGSIGITATRSPVYAWHDPRELDDDGHYRYQDQGWQDFTYLVRPHGGDWHDADLPRLAAELATPPRVQLESFHAGSRPARHSFGEVSDGSVLLTVLKGAEDDAAETVVRLVETQGRRERVTVSLAATDRVWEAELAPHEIATYVVPADPAQPIRATDLLEWPLER